MDRLENFKALKNDPWYGKLYSKLKQDEVAFCIKFILETATLDLQSYLDQVRDLKYNSKNILIMNELLLVSKER